MKAILVKNNNFETIGFEVISNGRTLFSWGISSALKSNFQKEINVNDWMIQIFDLVKLQGILQERNEAVRNFFQAAGDNKLIKNGQAVNCKLFDERIDKAEAAIENIIKNII